MRMGEAPEEKKELHNSYRALLGEPSSNCYSADKVRRRGGEGKGFFFFLRGMTRRVRDAFTRIFPSVAKREEEKKRERKSNGEEETSATLFFFLSLTVEASSLPPSLPPSLPLLPAVVG